MELQQLRHFIIVSEYHSISRAARQLLISQPTLSRSIRALEADIGLALFDRKNNRMELTEAGKLLAREAHGILSEEARVRESLRELSAPEKAPVRIVYDCAEQHLLTSIERFLNRWPDARFSVLGNQRNAVSGDHFELLLTANEANLASRASKRLFSERLLCAVPANERYLTADSIPLSAVLRAPRIVIQGNSREEKPASYPLSAHAWKLPDSSSPKSAGLPFADAERLSADIKKLFQSTKLSKAAIICDNAPTACRFAAAGHGFLLLPEYALPEEFKSTVRLLPIDGLPLQRDVYLCWDKNAYFSPYAQRYRAYLLRYFSEAM